MALVTDLKNLGKHAIVYGFGIILGKAVGFFLIPLYTHYLTPKDYGILELLDLTGYFIGYLFGLGMDQSILKFYGQYDRIQDKNEILSSAILFNLLLGGALVLVLLPFSQHFSQYLFGTIDYSYLFVLLFVSLLFGSVLSIAKTILRAQHRSVMFTVISLGFTVAAAALNILFVAVLGLGVKGIYYSTLICTFFFLAYLVFYILKNTGLHFNWSKLRPMIHYGVYFISAGMFAFILNWCDRYFLNIYSTIETIGIYAVGYKLGMSIVMLVTVPFHFVWNAYLFEIEKRPDAKRTYASIATYFMLAITLAGLAVSIFSTELITIMAPRAYQDASRIMPLVALAMICMSSESVFQVGLLIKGKSQYISISKGIAAFVSVVFNNWLISRYDMMGAAITAVLSQAVSCVMIIHFSQRVYVIDFEYLRLAKIAGAGILAYSLTCFISSGDMWTSIILKTAALALFPLFLIASGFLSYEETAFLKRCQRQVRACARQT